MVRLRRHQQSPLIPRSPSSDSEGSGTAEQAMLMLEKSISEALKPALPIPTVVKVNVWGVVSTYEPLNE